MINAITFFVCLTSLSAGPTPGDHVVTTGGVRYDGKITYQDGAWVVIELASGEKKAFARDTLKEVDPVRLDSPSASSPSGERSVPHKEPATAPTKLESEWDVLGRSLSAGYTRGNHVVHPAPDREALNKLAASESEVIRGLASRRLGLEYLRDHFHGVWSDPTEFERRLGEELLAEIAKKAAFMLAGAEVRLLEVLRDVSDPNHLFHVAQDLEASRITIACVGALCETALRSLLVEAMSGRPHRDELAEPQVLATLKVVRPDDGVLVIRNRSKMDLHRCFVITELEIDREAITRGRSRQFENDIPAYLLLPLVGVDAETLVGAKRLQDLKWVWESIDKGSTAYVDKWRAGTTLEVGLAPLHSLTLAGKSARVWVCAEEGIVRLDLSVPELQEVVRKEFRRTRPPPKR